MYLSNCIYYFYLENSNAKIVQDRQQKYNTT